MTLPGSTVLHLHPVRWHGQGWVAIVFPARPGIARLTAYARGGETGRR